MGSNPVTLSISIAAGKYDNKLSSSDINERDNDIAITSWYFYNKP